MSEKMIFWILLACGPCGFAVSIILFGFPKAGAFGSYEGWEGWGIGVVSLFAAWRHKPKISNDTSEHFIQTLLKLGKRSFKANYGEAVSVTRKIYNSVVMVTATILFVFVMYGLMDKVFLFK